MIRESRKEEHLTCAIWELMLDLEEFFYKMAVKLKIFSRVETEWPFMKTTEKKKDMVMKILQ